MKRSQFLPWTAFALVPGGFIPPRASASGYPLDLDGSLRYTRPPTGSYPQSFRPTLGYVQGLLPMQDGLVRQGMYSKNPQGPWSTPAEVRNAGYVFEHAITRTTSPETPKVTR